MRLATSAVIRNVVLLLALVANAGLVRFEVLCPALFSLALEFFLSLLPSEWKAVEAISELTLVLCELTNFDDMYPGFELSIDYCPHLCRRKTASEVLSL